MLYKADFNYCSTCDYLDGGEDLCELYDILIEEDQVACVEYKERVDE